MESGGRKISTLATNFGLHRKTSEDRLPIERDCPYFPEFKFAKLPLCLGEDANLVDWTNRREGMQANFAHR